MILEDMIFQRFYVRKQAKD